MPLFDSNAIHARGVLNQRGVPLRIAALHGIVEVGDVVLLYGNTR